MEKLKFLIYHLHLLYHIPIQVFDNSSLIYSPSDELYAITPFITDSGLLAPVNSNKCTIPFIHFETPTIFNGWLHADNGISVCIGPIALKSLSGTELHQYKVSHHLINFNHFKITISTTPIVATMLSIINLELNGTLIDHKIILNPLGLTLEESRISENELTNYKLQNIIEDNDHLAYNIEESIMEAISSGDIDRMKDVMYNDLSNKVGIMAKTSFKQLEYTIITGLALFGRAAIKGGADPEEVFSISDINKRKIADCHDEHEIKKIWEAAQLALLDCVIRAKAKKDGNLYVEQIKRFVTKNLHSRITLDDISKHVGINKAYMSHQFSFETGIHLMRYIHEERVKASMNMLKYSTQSISLISEYLCFDTQSHFTSVFKRIAGTTPGAYRKANKVPGF